MSHRDVPSAAIPARVGMQDRSYPGRPEEEGGFSLVELLVVVIIIGILAAVAIPTYVGQREQAYSAAVQTDLRNAATAATACSAANNGLYRNGDTTCNIETLRESYDFDSSEGVGITDEQITADRWSASAVYEDRGDTRHFFDTESDSRVKQGRITAAAAQTGG